MMHTDDLEKDLSQQVFGNTGQYPTYKVLRNNVNLDPGF